jgi:hypothetical protein
MASKKFLQAPFVLAGGGDGVAEAQGVEGAQVGLVAGAVHLGGHQDHGLALLPQVLGHLVVGGGQVRAPVHGEEDQLGVLEGPVHLLLDLLLPPVPGPEPPGVHQEKAALLGFHHLLFQVTGDPGLVGHHRTPFAQEAVEEAGLAHVGPTHDHDLVHRHPTKRGGEAPARTSPSVAHRVYSRRHAEAGPFPAQGLRLEAMHRAPAQQEVRPHRSAPHLQLGLRGGASGPLGRADPRPVSGEEGAFQAAFGLSHAGSGGHSRGPLPQEQPGGPGGGDLQEGGGDRHPHHPGGHPGPGPLLAHGLLLHGPEGGGAHRPGLRRLPPQGGGDRGLPLPHGGHPQGLRPHPGVLPFTAWLFCFWPSPW